MKRRTQGGLGLSLATALALVASTVAGTVVATAAPTARAAGTVHSRNTGDGAVTVRVVTEVDADGAYDSGLEPGLPGVRVTLSDDAGAVLTATTRADGLARLTPKGSALRGGRYHVRVTDPVPGTLSPAVTGLGTGEDVIRGTDGFVDVSHGRDVTYTTGFWEPGVYCQENPALVTCNLAKGDATGQAGLVSFGGNFSNTSPGGTVRRLTDSGRQRAVFGIGTDRTGNTYLGTTVKRHTEYGPAGAVNAIYRYNRDSGAVTTFATLPGALTAHDRRDHYLDDDAVYGRVGREGLGDVDVSGDGRTLYTVDLNDSRLYAVPLQGTGDTVTAGTPRGYAVPRPAACSGDWHPYGIGVRGARVLVGGVCGAEDTVAARAPWGDPSQLSAHVYEFADGAFDEILTHRLDHARGCAYRLTDTTGPNAGARRCTDTSTVGEPMSARWEAWNERVPAPEAHGFVSAPQPMLSDIGIADDGGLVLGFRDRFGDMQGHLTHRYRTPGGPVSAAAAGDVLRACPVDGAYALESGARCGALTGSLPGNRLGPGDGEFYDDLASLPEARHDQAGEGGAVLQPYRGKLWTTLHDPYVNQPFEQGVRRWDSATGSVTGNLALGPSADSPLFGEGNGLADLDLVCDQAPVQTGSRVWYDTDGDGVQDPSEPPVPGVVVTLTPKGGGRVLTATTDANGEYRVGTRQGLRPHTSYAASFDRRRVDPTALPGSPALADLRWTAAQAGPDRATDSDVDKDGRTTVVVGGPGQVDHAVGAGLVGPVDALGDRVWRDGNGDGVQDPGERGVPGVMVRLADPSGRRTVRTTATARDGSYRFEELPDGPYRVCFDRPDGHRWTGREPGAVGDGPGVDPWTGCSPPVTLGPAHRTDLTLDAGLVESLTLTLVTYDGTPRKPVGGAVFALWQETNGRPGLQTGGPGPDTRASAGCPTDRRGRCSYDGLAAGGYYLVERAVPAGRTLPREPVTGPYALTPRNAGAGKGRTVTLTGAPTTRGQWRCAGGTC